MARGDRGNRGWRSPAAAAHEAVWRAGPAPDPSPPGTTAPFTSSTKSASGGRRWFGRCPLCDHVPLGCGSCRSACWKQGVRPPVGNRHGGQWAKPDTPEQTDGASKRPPPTQTSGGHGRRVRSSSESLWHVKPNGDRKRPFPLGHAGPATQRWRQITPSGTAVTFSLSGSISRQRQTTAPSAQPRLNRFSTEKPWAHSRRGLADLRTSIG